MPSRHSRVCVLVRSAVAAMHPRRLSHMRCRRSHHRSDQHTSRPRWAEATSELHQFKWLAGLYGLYGMEFHIYILVRKSNNHVFPATGHTTGDVSTSYTMIGAGGRRHWWRQSMRTDESVWVLCDWCKRVAPFVTLKSWRESRIY